MAPGCIEAGCDEAGRGCLAGPVAAAAVILPPGFDCTGLDDSKKLTAHQRDVQRRRIERDALAWCVVMVPPAEIDSINILNASIVGMHRALDGLGVTPDHIIVDGNRFREYGRIPFTTVVKGDAKYASIAAASILAKTHRDQLMADLAKECPGYGWEKSMGYPTAGHLRALERLGLTPHHRLTYAPCRRMLERKTE